ncbi:MAG TPA: AbrB/MazE/SpoVT family DNA-binding domain-containing protein [Candidatus Nitrosotenuis sp.]|nr:AbrB/MazE/SpoVT family DNA-binding domain-containing protein [Candidatus Nitrosotenuis sp.]
MDPFGRIVIPAEIRRRLNLEAGESLLLEEEGDHLLLRPTPAPSPWVERDGLLVFAGDVAGVDPVHALAEHRRVRVQELATRLP